MNVNCDGPVTFLQSRSPDDQYAAPFAGVLTSWSVRAGPSPPQRKFKVARPAGGDNFTIVGESSLKPLLANALNTFPVRIPVHADDVIGFFIPQTLSAPCGRTAAAGYSIHSIAGDAEPGSTIEFLAPDSGEQFAISATLEPDCDADGFGDETQDSDTSSCSPQPEPSKAGSTLTLDADKSKVKKGKKVTFAGELDAPENEAACESGQPVELQRKKPSQTIFVTVEEPQTTGSGNFSAKVKVKKTFEYRALVVETGEC